MCLPNQIVVGQPPDGFIDGAFIIIIISGLWNVYEECGFFATDKKDHDR